jgi:transposase-like protein
MGIKEAIINEYLEGKLDFRALSRKHGIGKSTIHEWVMQHRGHPRGGIKMLHLPLMEQQDSQSNLPTDVATLQKLLAEERLRTKLLTAVIEIAEEELKIPIRKKFGTKPLKK